MEEPIADEVRGILDGHIILNRELGARNHWPAIDILPSLSRVMVGIASDEHNKVAGNLREVLANYEKQRDLILLGAYQYGTDPKTDYAIDKIEQVEAFLKQGVIERDDFETTIAKLVQLFSDTAKVKPWPNNPTTDSKPFWACGKKPKTRPSAISVIA